MSTHNYNDVLIRLVNSLTKSEKRYFRLFSSRTFNKKSTFQFIVLFDIIDKYKSVDPDKLARVLPGLTAKQLYDFKKNLYQQIIKCLRIYNADQEHFDLSNQFQNARILYNKGLYFDSLSTLKKIKERALKKQNHLIAYAIIDFEKEIESIHITRSHSLRAQELEIETNEIRETIQSEADWSEFSLKLYAKFIENGHVKDDKEQEAISAFFNTHKPTLRAGQNQCFFERLYQSQSNEWYYFISQNFKKGYKYSLLCINLFDNFPQFKKSHPNLFIKGLHNCLSILYNCVDIYRHECFLRRLEDFINTSPALNENTKLMGFIYINAAQLNQVILSGKFSQSRPFLKSFENELFGLQIKIDDYRYMVFWYKMASIYFAMGDYNNCIRLLNKIINPNQKRMREDLQCFARLLNLISHFELKNDESLFYLIKSTYKFLLKMNETTKLHEVLIRFLKVSLFKSRTDLRESFIQLKLQLEILVEDPFSRRSFLYLDIISWLESKISDNSTEFIIYNKRKELEMTRNRRR